MTRLTLRAPLADGHALPRARRGFGLDSPLPADRRVILRAVLRHIAESRPTVVAFGLAGGPLADGVDGAPDLLLLAPGGRVIFVKVKPQAEDLTRAHRAFADLCRSCGVPLIVVRSLAEARQAFDGLHL